MLISLSTQKTSAYILSIYRIISTLCSHLQGYLIVTLLKADAKNQSSWGKKKVCSIHETFIHKVYHLLLSTLLINYFFKRIDHLILQRVEECKLILNEGGNFLKYLIRNCYKKLACSLQVTVLALQCYQMGRGNCFPNAFQICEHILMQKCCLSHQLLLVSSDQCKKCCIQKRSVA